MQQIIKQAGPSRQLFETVNFAFMKIFDFLVKTALFGAFLLFFGDLRHKSRPKIEIGDQSPSAVFRRNLWRKSPKKSRKVQKRAVLIKKSKIFIKAKLTVSKSCLLGPAYFKICWILGDAHSQNLSFLRRPSTKFIFFNFSDIATYPRKLGNQN